MSLYAGTLQDPDSEHTESESDEAVRHRTDSGHSCFALWALDFRPKARKQLYTSHEAARRRFLEPGKGIRPELQDSKKNCEKWEKVGPSVGLFLWAFGSLGPAPGLVLPFPPRGFWTLESGLSVANMGSLYWYLGVAVTVQGLGCRV